MKKPVILCSTLLLLSTMGNTHGFLQKRRQSFVRTSPSIPTVGSFGSESREGVPTTTTALSDMVSTGVFDPVIEAELCTTMAHFALDFTSLASPSRSLVRLFAVIGRVFAISADYLPDHSIHTEELMIQIFLLSWALRELVSDKVGAFITAQGQHNATVQSSKTNIKNKTEKL